MVSGISRGFAFLEFHTAEDAARWMTENRVRILAARSITDLFGGSFYNTPLWLLTGLVHFTWTQS